MKTVCQCYHYKNDCRTNAEQRSYFDRRYTWHFIVFLWLLDSRVYPLTYDLQTQQQEQSHQMIWRLRIHVKKEAVYFLFDLNIHH